MGGGILQFDNEASQGDALEYVNDEFLDTSSPATNNSGLTSNASTNPLSEFFGNDDAPRWGVKTLWIKDIHPVTDKSKWISDRPTFEIEWQESFPPAKGYVFGSVALTNGANGRRIDLNCVGDGFGVGGVIRRVQWIVETQTGTATAQQKLDGSSTTTINFGSGTTGWDGQPKYNLYVNNTSDETADLHDYRIEALQVGKLSVTGVVVYYLISGSGIAFPGGLTYINKEPITTAGATLAYSAPSVFKGGRASLYKNTSGSYGSTTSLVPDISAVAQGSSGTNLLTLDQNGASFLPGSLVWVSAGTTQYVGNVLSRSTNTLTMGVTLSQGLSNAIQAIGNAGHTYSISSTMFIKVWEYVPGDHTPLQGSTIGIGVTTFFAEDPALRYRAWGGTLALTPGSSLSAGLGSTYGIELNQASSFFQVDGLFQALDFEFMAGSSGVLSATFGVNGFNAFNFNENINGPGIFKKTVYANGGPGWNSVVMSRGSGFTQVIITKVTGYQNTLFNGPTLGLLGSLDFGQTFLMRDAENATLMAFGNIRRVYADSLALSGSWTRGTTSTAAGGVYFEGNAPSMTGQFQYYGSRVALIGSAGTSMTITIDGVQYVPNMNTWLGPLLTEGFHTVNFIANTGTTRIEAIDFLKPSGELLNLQNYYPSGPATEYDQSTIKKIDGLVQVPPLGIGTTQLIDLSVTTGKLANQSVTHAKMATLAQQISSASPNVSAGTGWFIPDVMTEIPNLSITLTTFGRPVMIGIQSSGVSTLLLAAGLQANTGKDYLYQFVRDSSVIGSYTVAVGVSVSAILPPIPPIIDPVAAGTYTYKLQVQTTSGSSGQGQVYPIKLYGFEL